MTEDEQAIRSLVSSWMEATARGDVDAVLGLMTEDAMFLTPGQPPMNKAAFAATSRSQVSGKLRIDAKSEVQEVHVDGSMAYLWSHLDVTVTAEGANNPIHRAGHTLTIFRKVGGRWLLSRDANMLVKI